MCRDIICNLTRLSVVWFIAACHYYLSKPSAGLSTSRQLLLCNSQLPSPSNEWEFVSSSAILHLVWGDTAFCYRPPATYRRGEGLCLFNQLVDQFRFLAHSAGRIFHRRAHVLNDRSFSCWSVWCFAWAWWVRVQSQLFASIFGSNGPATVTSLVWLACSCSLLLLPTHQFQGCWLVQFGSIVVWSEIWIGWVYDWLFDGGYLIEQFWKTACFDYHLTGITRFDRPIRGRLWGKRSSLYLTEYHNCCFKWAVCACHDSVR